MVGVNADLSVGYVAGMIAAAIVVVRWLCPTATAYILAGLLKDTESAATWTVAGESLQSTPWPYLVRSDSSRSSGRARRLVRVVASTIPAATFLAAIASIVTPLGLGEAIVPLGEQYGDFRYVEDLGPYAFGMTPRGLHELSRICEQGPGFAAIPATCPFSETIVDIEGNGTSLSWELPNGYNASVPSALVDIFSSGTEEKETTIANFFDIEWRQITSRRKEYINDNETYSVAMYRQLDSFILDGEYKLLEGLVVDAKTGGIGFRNHTAPVGREKGASWSEDILFVGPVTSCVNTNLTVDFEALTEYPEGADEVLGEGSAGFRDVRITDHGGFFDLNKTYPYANVSDPQRNPDLEGRAYKAAWMHNAYTMLFFNVTNPNDEELNLTAFAYINSEEDRVFKLGNETNTQDFRKLDLTSDFDTLLPLPSGSNSSYGDNSSRWPNPWNVTTDFFDGINTICGGGNADVANLSLIYVGCSLMRGAPRRVDPGPQGTFEQGSRWSSPLHACATGLEASIKTVEFSINGSTSLDSLRVRSIEPKLYSSPEKAPLWGMEDFNMTIGGYAPVWGIISPEYEDRENISTLRHPRLLLPGLSGSGSQATTLQEGVSMSYNLAGANFAFSVMNKALQLGSSALSSERWQFDLLGGSSMSIFKRWQDLSAHANTAAEIINLIWTDIAASAVVGTKGASAEMNKGNSDMSIIIRPYGTRITYSLPFGIPAFILIAAMAVLGFLALISTIIGGSSLLSIRNRLAQLSIGRAFTTFLYPRESTLTMSFSAWRDVNAGKPVQVGNFIHVTEAQEGRLLEPMKNGREDQR